VATVCGLEHTAIPIGSDFLTDYQGYLDRTVYVTDGSAGPLGAHEIYYSKLARQHSLVRLTGNYGSEILRSMSTFKPARRPPGFLSVANEDLLAAARISETGDESVTQSAFREIPWHLFGTLSACRSLQVFRTPYLDNELVRLACQAPESARNSPNAALKLIQACDPRLARVPTDRGVKAGDGKAISMLKRVGTGLSFKLDYLDKEGLPGKLRAMDPVLDAMARLGLLGRHKFLPYRRWFRKELRPVLRQGIERARDHHLPWIDAANLDVVDSEHFTGRVNHLSQINAILSLEAVNRLLVRGEGFGTIGKAETHGPDGT
jgi:asparagine synthase (glutamine-hydrolysing)